MQKPRVHPSLVQCRINIALRGVTVVHATLSAKDHARLEDASGQVVVDLWPEDDLPCRVVEVRFRGHPIESYSIIPNGKRTRSRFALT